MMKYWNSLIFFLICSHLTIIGQSLVINEIMADNETTFADANVQYHDWIELYNPSNQTIDLQGWYLSDDESDPHHWQFPNGVTIAPNGYLVIFASDDDGYDGTFWHTNFRLSKEGEAVLLSRSDGTPADLIVFPELKADQSFGRQPNGDTHLFYFQHPTPGQPNSLDGQIPFYNTSLLFSHPPGHYPGGLWLEILANRQDMEIRYTLDGSEPQYQDELYAGPIHLHTDNLPNARLSKQPTSDTWQHPVGEVQTHHVVRARAFRNGQPASKVFTSSFFTRDKMPYSLPVVSVVTLEENLFDDERGIYHRGVAENYFGQGDEWERPVHVEFFDKNGQLLLAQDAGARISGFTTRANPQKTLKLYARSEYGKSQFEYPFFGENHHNSFKRLGLRTLSGDWSHMAFSDDFCHELILGEVEADHARRRFVIVLINGEYWGIHSLREFVDHHFYAQKSGVDADEINSHINWDHNAETGSPESFNHLWSFFQSNDLSGPLQFQAVNELIDLENFTDYHVMQIALANADWPNNNVKFWQPQVPGGRWRWAATDLDGCLKGANHSGLNLYFSEQRYLLSDWERRERSFFMLRKLFENETYRQYFVSRLNGFLLKTMSPSRSIPLLKSLADELAPEMPRHIRRWHFPEDMKQWEKGIDEAENFLLKRQLFLLNEVHEWLGPPIKVYPNPTSGVLSLDMISAVPATYQLELMDTWGRSVFSKKMITEEGASVLHLTLPEGLADGIYCLRIFDGQLGWSEKIVVNR